MASTSRRASVTPTVPQLANRSPRPPNVPAPTITADRQQRLLDVGQRHGIGMGPARDQPGDSKEHIPASLPERGSGGHGNNPQFRSMFYAGYREPAFVSSGWALLGPRGQDASGIIAGALGGLVSSTATTLSFAGKAREAKELGLVAEVTERGELESWTMQVASDICRALDIKNVAAAVSRDDVVQLEHHHFAASCSSFAKWSRFPRYGSIFV